MRRGVLEEKGEMTQGLMLPADTLNEWKAKSLTLPSLNLSERQLCDIELLLNGGFSPLKGFLTHDDYQSVLSCMRLKQGALWPIPITLDVSEKFADIVVMGEHICLRDEANNLLAMMHVTDIWQADKNKEAETIFATTDVSHSGVDTLINKTNKIYLGGPLFGIQLPKHYDYLDDRLTPHQLKQRFQAMQWQAVMGFQTRNLMHRAHQALTLQTAEDYQANLLLQPVVGMTKPGDIDYFTRVKCYKALINCYPQPQNVILHLLPLAMRMAGPREALWHAIIRKNYGCTHFIINRNHAGPGKNKQGKDFYTPYEAQTLVKQHESELGITMALCQEMVYVKNTQKYMPIDQVHKNQEVLKISSTEFRRLLQADLDIPHWFSHAKVIEQLRQMYPPKIKQGVTVFFTGLSGAGKSTIANVLMVKLRELTHRCVTLLDGDEVRQHLSSELGFSKQHRDLNIYRIGFVALQITKNGGIAICAPIAPYAAIRNKVSENIQSHGGFIEVYISTSLKLCEKRDPKNLYAKARSGLIKNFTGIDASYEAPLDADVEIDTENISADSAADMILTKLADLGYLKLGPVPIEECSLTPVPL